MVPLPVASVPEDRFVASGFNGAQAGPGFTAFLAMVPGVMPFNVSTTAGLVLALNKPAPLNSAVTL